jgi:DNA-directed RNA polymerase I, II, and III subunit RPABC2
MTLSTSKYMTRYECAHVLGIRARQLSMGAEPQVPTNGETNTLVIARKELFAKKLPILIRRTLPDGITYEDVNIQDLSLDNLIK